MLELIKMNLIRSIRQLPSIRSKNENKRNLNTNNSLSS